MTELAERVQLSVSPCHRRLRALERSGAISGYRAYLDAETLGLTFEALVFVTMRAADRDTVEAFEEAVDAVPHVLQAQRLFGDPDYLLRIVARDLPAFQNLTTSASPHARRPAPQLHTRHEERRREPTPYRFSALVPNRQDTHAREGAVGSSALRTTINASLSILCSA